MTEEKRTSSDSLFYERLDFSKELAQQICAILYHHNILSCIIEGGQKTLQTFIDANLWDEARVFEGRKSFEAGVVAPKLDGALVAEVGILEDALKIF